MPSKYFLSALCGRQAEVQIDRKWALSNNEALYQSANW